MNSLDLYTLLFVIALVVALYWFGVRGLLAVVLIVVLIGFYPEI